MKAMVYRGPGRVRVGAAHSNDRVIGMFDLGYVFFFRHLDTNRVLELALALSLAGSSR